MEGYKNLQIINSRFVAGRGHLELAIEQAKKAFEYGANISDNFFIEILVRASGQRQIKKAIKLFGVENSKEVIVICEKLPKGIAKKFSCVEDEGIFNINKGKIEELKKVYEINEKEIDTLDGKDRVDVLKEIVKERVALVSVL